MDWRDVLFPQLKSLPTERRDHVWRIANAEPFQRGEWAVIVAAVVIAALFVRSVRFNLIFGSPLLAFAGDFILAGGVLLVIAGPVYWRRTRRGLASALNSSKKE